MHDVIIVGGGVSGLAAADTLSRMKCDWLLLEAKPRLGGRVFSGPNGFEYGAEFIHGETSITHHLLRTRLSQGRALRAGTSKCLLHAHGPQELSASAFNEALKWFRDQKFHPSHTLVDALNLSKSTAASAVMPHIVFWLASQECALPSQLSARALVEGFGINADGDNLYWISPTYDTLLDAFSFNGPIRLSHAVTSVSCGDVGCEVMTENGEKHQSRCVILSCSVGVFKTGRIHVEPQLSQLKRDAFSAIGMGRCYKIGFEVPFSNDASTHRYDFYIPTEGSVTYWWKRKTTAGYVYSAMLRVPGKDEASIDDCNREINNFWPLVSSQSPINRYAFDWSHEEWVWGAYSHVPALSTGIADLRKALALPEGKRIFFCGEATAPAGAGGSVHGAIDSGIRAAAEAQALSSSNK